MSRFFRSSPRTTSAETPVTAGGRRGSVLPPWAEKSAFLARLATPGKSLDLVPSSSMGGLATLPTSTGLVVGYVAEVGDVCGGVVGSSGLKFCLRSHCTVGSHKTKSTINPGLYLLAGEEVAYATPTVEAAHLSEAQVQSLLAEHDVGAAKDYMRILAEAGAGEGPLGEDFVQERLEEVQRLANFKTPSAKRRKVDLRAELMVLEKFGNLNEGEGDGIGDGVKDGLGD